MQLSAQQTSSSHPHDLHLPSSSYAPVAPFVTQRVVSRDGRITSIQTQRMVDPQKMAMLAVPDFAEAHQRELQELRRQRDRERRAMSPRRLVVGSPAGSRHPDPQIPKASVPRLVSSSMEDDSTNRYRRMLPATASYSTLHQEQVNYQGTTVASHSIWERMTHLTGHSANDRSFWEPKSTAGPSNLLRTVSRNYNSDQTRQEEDAASDTGDNEVAAEAGKRLIVSLIGDSSPSALQLGQRGETNGSRMMSKHSSLDQLPPEVAFPCILIEHTQQIPVMKDHNEVLRSAQFGESLQERLGFLLSAPRTLLHCPTHGSNMVERFVSIEALNVPCPWFSGQRKRLFLSIRVARNPATPSLARLALDQLVDVTVGCALRHPLMQHLRTATDEPRAKLLDIDVNEVLAMQKKLEQFIQIRQVKPTTMTATPELRSAYRAACDDYCTAIEKEFPFLAGPAVSFQHRKMIPSNRCFTCWFLSEDNITGTAVDFVVEREEEGVAWVECLRGLMKLNSSTIVSRAVAAQLQASPPPPPPPPPPSIPVTMPEKLSLEDRRWRCHVIVQDMDRRNKATSGVMETNASSLAAVLQKTTQLGLSHRPPPESVAV